MRHAIAAFAAALTLLASAALVDRVASRSSAPGLIIVWSARPAQVLAGLPQGTRVVDSWWSGRLLQLHVESLRAAPLPRGQATFALRLPESSVILAGCG